MKRLANGDEEALRPLHRRYAPIAFGIAARSLGAPAAEEVVQETFFAVWRERATFDPARGSFRSWILQIAHRRVLNELRQRERRPKSDGAEDAIEGLVDPEADVDASAWRDYQRTAVRRAVESLPDAQRQALTLAFFDDLTHEQVSSFLETPLGTTKTRVRAGLSRLRLALAGLVAAALVIVVGAVIAQRRLAQAAMRERALKMVTASDVVAIRIPAAPGQPDAVHGNYRSRPGSTLVVLTLSNLPPLGRGETYQAWARFGATKWVWLGTAVPDEGAKAILVAEDAALATSPDAVEVTIEPAVASSIPGARVVLAWPK